MLLSLAVFRNFPIFFVVLIHCHIQYGCCWKCFQQQIWILYQQQYSSWVGEGGLVHDYWNHNIRIYKISHLPGWVHRVSRVKSWPEIWLAWHWFREAQPDIGQPNPNQQNYISSWRNGQKWAKFGQNWRPKGKPNPALIPSIVRYRFGFSGFRISGNFFVIPIIKNPLHFVHSVVVRLFPPAAIGSCFL